ncbi:MAG: ABC transporter permease [Paludibaculum sp.]
MLRLRSLFRRQTVERELEAELGFHLDQLIQENLSAGMTPEEARWAAQRTLGGISQFQEECRDSRRVQFLEDLVQDVKFTLRSLAKSPGFTAVVILTLALGIGANTAIFTIVRGVLLRPLDYPGAERLLLLTAESPATGGTGNALSAPEYTEFRQMNRSFSEVGAFSTGGAGYTTGEVNLMAGDRPVRVRSVAVDARLLEDSRSVPPEQGRFFREGRGPRARTGTLPPPVALLSHELWQSGFGGRPLIGQKVEIEGRPHEIVGILPPGADLMDRRPQVWLPLWLHPNIAQERGAHVLSVIARLNDGTRLKTAQAELRTLLEDWGERAGRQRHAPTSHPVHASEHTLHLQPLREAIAGSAGKTLWVLQAAVGFGA